MIKCIFISLVGIIPITLFALPTNPTVVSGGASITSEGSATLNIKPTSTTTSITWDTFSTANGELVHFTQGPAIAGQEYYVINTVTGSTASTIAGQVNTSDNKGNIYLINPTGISISATGVINTGSFLASTLDMVTPFTPTANLEFSGTSTASITNNGMIYTSGGDAVFIGYRVVNNSTISAAGASVIGTGVDLIYKPADDDRIFIQTSGASGSGTGISNTSTGIISGDSAILVSDGNIYALSINHAGTMSCTSCVNTDGKVLLVADGKLTGNGSVNISGSITRSNTGGEGPDVGVYGANLTLASGGSISTRGDTAGGDITFGSLSLYPTSVVNINANSSMTTSALTSGNAGSISSYASTASDVLGSFTARGAGTGSGGAVSFTSPLRLNIGPSAVDLTGGSSNYGTFTATSNDLRGGATSSLESVVTKAGLELILAKGNAALVANQSGNSGNINFSDIDITWAAGTMLSLNATGTIQVDKDITQTASGYSGRNLLSLTGTDIIIGNSLKTQDESAGFVLTSGDFSVDASNSLNLYGGDATNASAKLNTENGTATVLFGANLRMVAGDGSGTDAELHATTTTVNAKTQGVGDILIQAGDCSHSRLEGTTVNIGVTTKPANTTIIGGCCGNDNDATIGGKANGASVNLQLTGDLSITGGSGGASNHAQIFTPSGTGNITVSVRDLNIDGGISGSNNHARIRHDGTSGTVSITTVGDAMLSGAGTGSVLSSAEIRGPLVSLDIGRDLDITGGQAQSNLATIHGYNGISGYIRRHMNISGGTFTGSIAAIRVDNGNIILDNPNGSGTWTIEGNTSGTANESGKIITDVGNIYLGQTSAPNIINIISGGSGVSPVARVEALTSGHVRVKARQDVNINGGGAATTSSTASVKSALGNVELTAGRDVNITSGTSTVANAEVSATLGTTTLTSGRDTTLVGSCQLPNKANLTGTSTVTANVTGNLTQNGNTTLASSAGATNVTVGGTHTVISCSSPAPIVNPSNTVFPGSDWYKYIFLYELLYRLNYYTWYDWYLFHSEEFFDRVMVPSP